MQHHKLQDAVISATISLPESIVRQLYNDIFLKPRQVHFESPLVSFEVWFEWKKIVFQEAQ